METFSGSCLGGMRLFDLPVPFLGNSGNVQVLLTAVGLRLPAAFQKLHSIVSSLTNTLELDVRSVAPDFFNILGQVKFEISVCESSDALRFLLGLTDPLSPHLDFHVIVGAAIAESEQELLACTCTFDKIVRESVSKAVPCLFVFTSSTFDGSCLPACATQIPSDSSEQDVARRVREGFVRCTMEFLIEVKNKCDDLNADAENFENQVMLASWAYMFGGREVAFEYYQNAARGRPAFNIIANLFQVKSISSDNDFDMFGLDKEVGPCEFRGLPNDVMCSVAAAFRTSDRFVQVRALLRAAYLAPDAGRDLLVRALSIIGDGSMPRQMMHYTELALLLLLHTKNDRTFMFRTAMHFDSVDTYPSFLLKRFADCVTSGDDWCEQRVTSAAKLFGSKNVPRAIKNILMSYLLGFMHRIPASDRQRDLLALIPTGMELDAMSLVDVRGIEVEPPLNPIRKATAASKVFIYSPLNQSKEELRCAAGDMLSFDVVLFNPLSVPITFDTISLTGTNATCYPVMYTLPANRQMRFPLSVRAGPVGEMTISGFVFTSGNLTGIYNLPNKITYNVIEKLPVLVVKQPSRFDTRIMKNSRVTVPFRLMNTSNADVNLKGITFGPIPGVLTPTSLPIDYPPTVEPPLPDVLKTGATQDFFLKFPADQTNNVLSFAIEYGTNEFSRRFEMNQALDIIDGPGVRNVQVIPLDDHDDFDTKSVTLLTIVENPLETPLSVRCRGSDEITVIEPQSLGTFVLQVERIDIQLDAEQRWDAAGIDKDHVRKCEVVATKEKNAKLDLSEKRILWSSLLLKKSLQDQLQLDWELPNGLTGTLPFTHVKIDTSTLTLLQPPPFTVAFSMEKLRENIWNITCAVNSAVSIPLKAKLTFDANGSEVFMAGQEENDIESPASFKTAIHCTPNVSLLVIGKFYVGDVYFVRRATFQLK